MQNCLNIHYFLGRRSVQQLPTNFKGSHDPKLLGIILSWNNMVLNQCLPQDTICNFLHEQVSDNND